LKTCEDLGKTSKDIIKEGILFPSFKTYYMEGNTQKTKKHAFMRMKIALMCLGHVPCTLGICHAPWAWVFTLCAPTMHPGHTESGSKLVFPLFKWKSPVFKLKPRWKVAYKYNFSHS